VKRIRLALSLICLATPWSQSHADAWGQLFTTSAQRAQLDGGQIAVAKTGNASDNVAQAASVKTIRLTGTLTSSRGIHTVWLNGKPADRDVRILTDGRVELHISSSTDHRLMKSGQLLNPQTGEIVEGYAAPQITPADHAIPTDTDSMETLMQAP